MWNGGVGTRKRGLSRSDNPSRRAAEMPAANRVEGSVDASTAAAAYGEPTHGRDEIAGAIVDRDLRRSSRPQ
jgi:hypothetical protein